MPSPDPLALESGVAGPTLAPAWVIQMAVEARPRSGFPAQERRSGNGRWTKAGGNGFTLLEVLVGIALLAMAAVVLGAAYVNTLNAHDAVARRAATGSGMEFLREAVLNESERKKVENGGSLILPENRHLHWTAVVEEAPVPDLFRVVVRGQITGDAAKDNEEFEQTLMLLRPTWSEAGRREQLRTDWAKQREEAMR